MTFSELYETVSHFGFDTDLEDFKSQFIDAANRGFKQVTRRFPRMGEKRYILEEKDRQNGMVLVNVKDLVNGVHGGEYASLPENPVRTMNGELFRNDQYRLFNRDTILFLPKAVNGEYIIDYVKRAPKFNLDSFNKDMDIDLDDDLCEALALYCAYYVLLEENAELASAYYARYTEMMSEIILTKPTHTPNGYRIDKGW